MFHSIVLLVAQSATGVLLINMKYKNREVKIVHITDDGEILIMFKDTGEQQFIWDEELLED